MLSSADWVTSAAFCCTSMSTGWVRLLEYQATPTKSGAISSASAVSSGSIIRSNTA